MGERGGFEVGGWEECGVVVGDGGEGEGRGKHVLGKVGAEETSLVARSGGSLVLNS